MTIGEIVPVEMKFLGCSFSRFAIPTVRENHAAIVPEKRLDLIHAVSSEWLSAFSQFLVSEREGCIWPQRHGLHYPYPAAIAKEQKDVAAVAGDMMS